MSAVLINPVLNCASTLSYVHTAAFTRDLVNPWRTESYGLFVRGQVTGYFLRWDGHTFYVISGEHSAQASKGGLGVRKISYGQGFNFVYGSGVGWT